MNDCTVRALKLCSGRYGAGESQFVVSTLIQKHQSSFYPHCHNMSCIYFVQHLVEEWCAITFLST